MTRKQSMIMLYVGWYYFTCSSVIYSESALYMYSCTFPLMFPLQNCAEIPYFLPSLNWVLPSLEGLNSFIKFQIPMNYKDLISMLALQLAEYTIFFVVQVLNSLVCTLPIYELVHFAHNFPRTMYKLRYYHRRRKCFVPHLFVFHPCWGHKWDFFPLQMFQCSNSDCKGWIGKWRNNVPAVDHSLYLFTIS